MNPGKGLDSNEGTLPPGGGLTERVKGMHTSVLDPKQKVTLVCTKQGTMRTAVRMSVSSMFRPYLGCGRDRGCGPTSVCNIHRGTDEDSGVPCFPSLKRN